MQTFLQAVILGMGAGALDANLALGIVLIYRTTGVLNFGQAATGALAVYIMYSVAQGRPLWLALVTGLLAGAVLGLATYVAVSAIRSHHYSLTAAVATLAIAILYGQSIGIFWGGTAGTFPSPFPVSSLSFAGMTVQYATLYGILTAGALALALGAFLRWTRTGTMLRALADNRDAAKLCGANSRLLLRGAWAFSGMLAAVSGFYVAQFGLTPSFLDPFFVAALIAAVLGGLRSLSAAFVAALLLEVVRNLFLIYAPQGVTAYAQSFLFLLLILILSLSPRRWISQAPQRLV